MKTQLKMILTAAIIAIGRGCAIPAAVVVLCRQTRRRGDITMTTKNRFLSAAPLVAVAAALLLVAGCGDKPGLKLREIERVQDMSDDEIGAAREQCHLISTTDYNCSELVHPQHGMTPDEWKVLTESTKECRKNQLLSFHHCLRGKGVRYPEYD